MSIMAASLPLRPQGAISITPQKAPLLKPRKTRGSNNREMFSHTMWHWEKEHLRAVSNTHLLFVIEGTADIEIGVTETAAQQKKLNPRHGRFTLRLPEGSVLVLPPYVPSSDGSLPHWDNTLPQSAPEGHSRILWLNLLPEGAMCHVCCTRSARHAAGPRHFLLDSHLLTIGELLLDELRQADSSSDIANAHLASLLLRVERNFLTARVSPDESGQTVVAPLHSDLPAAHSVEPTNAAILERACQYIENHLSEPLTATLVAEHSYASASHLNRLFRAEFNTSIMKFVEQQRVQVAESLLQNTNLPISVISHHVGYKHVSHFSLAFRRNAGVSPLQYRHHRDTEKPLQKNKSTSVTKS